MAAKRVAVVLIPNFAMAVFGKTQRSRAHGAIALVDTLEDISPVTAINRAAAEAGITCGMTTTQAQAFCPGLVIYQRDLIAEWAEAHAIAGWLGSLSPTVHEDAPGRYRLDASGMSLLYYDEILYAEKILTTLRPLGYTVQVGLAQNPFVARVAAERAEPAGYLIIPAHEEKAFLSGLGREYLEMSAETASLLHDLGIEHISQVSAFPINEMTERFGAEGTTLVAQARGDDLVKKRQVRAPDATGAMKYCRSKPLPRSGRASARGFDILSSYRRSGATPVAEKPDILSPDECTTTRFFWSPLEQTQYLRRHINRLLGDLLARLRPLGQGCACVEITLHLDNRTDRLISLVVDKPTLSVRSLLRQWQTRSEKMMLASGIAGLTVTIPHLRPLLIEQMALRTHRAVSTVPVVLPDSVYRPCLRPGILPENCFELLPSGTHPKERATRQPLNNHRLWRSIGLRLLQPPRTVQMQLKNNRPSDITWAGRHRAITRTLGPWELSGHWWRTAFHRRYYEIIVETHQRYLVFCTEEDARWFMQGVFD